MAVSVGSESGVLRDSKGRFQRGSKPGPGAPKNQHTAAVQAVREAALEHGLPCLIETARGGDIEAAKALCGLGLPKLRPVSIMERVPVDDGKDVGQKAADVFHAIAAGGLTTDTATVLLSALQVFAEAAQLQGMQTRLSELEERAQQGRTGVLLVPGVLSPDQWIKEAQGADDGEEPTSED